LDSEPGADVLDVPVAPALEATFARRKTELPRERPTALSDVFLKDKEKTDQWKAFLNRMRLPKDLSEFDTVGDAIARFLMPVIEAARAHNDDEQEWPARGPWKRPRVATSGEFEK
jgi:hypothetical protein